MVTSDLRTFRDRPIGRRPPRPFGRSAGRSAGLRFRRGPRPRPLAVGRTASTQPAAAAVVGLGSRRGARSGDPPRGHPPGGPGVAAGLDRDGPGRWRPRCSGAAPTRFSSPPSRSARASPSRSRRSPRASSWEGLNAYGFIIILIYALFRWGSGREAVIGVALPLTAVLVSAFDSAVADVVGGLLLVLFVSALGAAVRFRGTARLRGLDQAKLREREQLARELHDTVAHHVSAIAIQAQAGRTVAESHPEAVLDALVVIEKEASRALDRDADDRRCPPPGRAVGPHAPARRCGHRAARPQQRQHAAGRRRP